MYNEWDERRVHGWTVNSEKSLRVQTDSWNGQNRPAEWSKSTRVSFKLDPWKGKQINSEKVKLDPWKFQNQTA